MKQEVWRGKTRSLQESSREVKQMAKDMDMMVNLTDSTRSIF
jgi:hypothetical protein